MALFLTNICKYKSCGKIFPTLNDLILHIEKTHIDFDPKVMEQKEQALPASIPMSCILPFTSEDERNKATNLTTNAMNFEKKARFPISTNNILPSTLSNTLTGSDMNGDEMVANKADDSKDFWTSDMIMQYGGRPYGGGYNRSSNKPYSCPVPGCCKCYKNANGLKYHSKNGHKKEKLRKTMLGAQETSGTLNGGGGLNSYSPFHINDFLTNDTSCDGGSKSDNSDIYKYSFTNDTPT